jgi:hypothetical protein
MDAKHSELGCLRAPAVAFRCKRKRWPRLLVAVFLRGTDGHENNFSNQPPR